MDWELTQAVQPMIQNAATGQTDFGGAFNGAIIKLISQRCTD